jgi:hypothetical protein
MQKCGEAHLLYFSPLPHTNSAPARWNESRVSSRKIPVVKDNCKNLKCVGNPLVGS